MPALATAWRWVAFCTAPARIAATMPKKKGGKKKGGKKGGDDSKPIREVRVSARSLMPCRVAG